MSFDGTTALSITNFIQTFRATCGASRTIRVSVIAGGTRHPKGDLPRLAQEASEQWTGRFNPRPLNALEIYECAW